MKQIRMVLLVSLLAIACQAFATEYAFMGFDIATQKMYAVVQGDAPFHAVITYTQSNMDGYIGEEEQFPTAPVEVWGEAELSPLDPDRFTDIPDGTVNVITANIAIYDATGENFLYNLAVNDTLVANVDGGNGYYTYLNAVCDPPAVLPTTIEINTAFCAWICHGSYTIPIACEGIGYNPDLLEVGVSNGCDPTDVHITPTGHTAPSCNDPDCAPIDWSLFAWHKRVFDGCRLYLTMTYCDGDPGCLCIWRSDFELPVEMGGFTALAGDDKVDLSWVTRSESDLDAFIVVRSDTRDGVYHTVYSTTATNNPSGHNYTWTDTDVENGRTYFYKLHIRDVNGDMHVYNVNGSTVIASATPSASPLPSEYSLSNYPNPFNSQTTFEFTLPMAGFVTLKVYDLLGREVATLVNRDMAAGNHNLNWSADGLSAGVYMYTFQSGSFSQTNKMLFLK